MKQLLLVFTHMYSGWQAKTRKLSKVSNFWWCETLDTASLTMVSTFPAYVPFDEQRVSRYWRTFSFVQPQSKFWSYALVDISNKSHLFETGKKSPGKNTGHLIPGRHKRTSIRGATPGKRATYSCRSRKRMMAEVNFWTCSYSLLYYAVDWLSRSTEDLANMSRTAQCIDC